MTKDFKAFLALDTYTQLDMGFGKYYNNLSCSVDEERLDDSQSNPYGTPAWADAQECL